MPTADEDKAITRAALDDPDNLPLSDAEWVAVKPSVRGGRPCSAAPKQRITIRLSPDVVEQFRASGPGWQSRVDAALRDWLRNHSPDNF